MKKRVALITEIIAPYRIPVFNALSQHPEIDLHVIFLAETDGGMRHWKIYRDEIAFSYEVLRSWRWRQGSHSLLLHRGLGSALARISPEAVICGGYNYPASWQSQLWAHRHKVPFMVWVESNANDARTEYRWIEKLKRKFLLDCEAVIVAGRSSWSYVEQFGVHPRLLFTAPDAVDSEFFSRESDFARKKSSAVRAALSLPARYMLFAGRMVREKGIYDLLEAYTLLPEAIRSEFSLVFVGAGAEEKILARLAHILAPGRAIFAGFQHRERLAEYYALADAFVFPTHSDPWGLVVNEAMASGLPVIASDVAGCVPDLVTDGWNGCVFRSRSVPALMGAMQRVAADSELRRQMGERSAARIRNFTPGDCAAGMASAVLSCWGAHAG